MNRSKVLFGCLLATLLVGPLGQIYGRGGHGGGGHHGGGGGGHAAAAIHGGGGGHWHGGGGHWHGGHGWHGGNGWHGHNGWWWGGWGLGPWWWGGWNGWAHPYTVDYNVYVQGSTCSVTPDDVYTMTNNVASATKYNLSEAARNLAEQYKSEYNTYVQMLQNNDPAASDQACKLQGIYESFQNVYQSQSTPTNINPSAGGYMNQPTGMPSGTMGQPVPATGGSYGGYGY